MLVFGTSLFQGWLAPPALAGELALLARRSVGVGLGLAAATSLAWLMLTAGAMVDGWADTIDPSTVGLVLTDTAFGRLWQWRLGFVAVAVGLATLGLDGRFAATTILAALLLASLGFEGHPGAATGTAGGLLPLNHAVHLVAAGFWLGCLPLLVVCLGRAGERAGRQHLAAALRRFYVLGHGAVALVVATGMINTGLILRGFPVDLSSPYRALLLSKIGLVAVMIAAAAANRYILLPRFDAAPRRSAVLLRASTIAELLLGLGVLGVVSILGTLMPA
jgi:putative copper resistance protein D